MKFLRFGPLGAKKSGNQNAEDNIADVKERGHC